MPGRRGKVMNDTVDTPYADWIGQRETRRDMIGMGTAQRLQAVLETPAAPLEKGDPLPPLWHWIFFLTAVPQSQLGGDGHPKPGSFGRPIDLPRRMFAGADITYHAPLTLGALAYRDSEITAIEEKAGKSGKLTFVTMVNRITQQDTLCLEEKQFIVYRDTGPPVWLPEPRPLENLPENANSRSVTPDSTLLFRYSALTFNTHRIHYDEAYATGEEGYPGLVVHGPLTATLLAAMAAEHGALRRFKFSGRAPLFAGQPIRLSATPGGDGTLALKAERCDGALAVEAAAEIAR